MKFYVYSTGDSAREARHLQFHDKQLRKKADHFDTKGRSVWEYTPVDPNPDVPLESGCAVVVFLLPRTQWVGDDVQALIKRFKDDRREKNEGGQIFFITPIESPGNSNTTLQLAALDELKSQPTHVCFDDMVQFAESVINWLGATIEVIHERANQRKDLSV